MSSVPYSLVFRVHLRHTYCIRNITIPTRELLPLFGRHSIRVFQMVHPRMLARLNSMPWGEAPFLAAARPIGDLHAARGEGSVPVSVFGVCVALGAANSTPMSSSPSV